MRLPEDLPTEFDAIDPASGVVCRFWRSSDGTPYYYVKVEGTPMHQNSVTMNALIEYGRQLGLADRSRSGRSCKECGATRFCSNRCD